MLFSSTKVNTQKYATKKTKLPFKSLDNFASSQHNFHKVKLWQNLNCTYARWKSLMKKPNEERVKYGYQDIFGSI